MNKKNILTLTLGLAATGIIGSTQVAHADTQIDTNTIQVSQGDTLGEIANEHNISLDSLVKENHIGDANLIYVGDKLSINGDVAQANTTTHAPQTPAQAPNTQAKQTTTTTPKTSTSPSQSTPTSNIASSSEQSAKDFIAYHESRGNYSASNGKYVGRYQLDRSYLHGDYSVANQEKVFAQYVQQRYGSYANAAQHERTHGWY